VRQEALPPARLHLVAPPDDAAAFVASRAHVGHSLVDVAAALARLLPSIHPVGLATDPRDERLRFHHTSSLGFRGDEVVDVSLSNDPPVATITASLLGLCGLESPLPLYLLDDADRDDDPGAALRGLLDVVHHRLLSLLLRALHERDVPESLPCDSPWTRRLLALVGLRESAALPLPVLLDLLPVWACGVRSPATLAAALRLALAEFPAAVRVDPWTGGWLPIDRDQHTRLGEPTAHLGDTAVLGTEILHPAGAATVVVGPVPVEHHRAFLPGGLAHARIAAVCQQFAAGAIRLDLAVELASRPPPLLGERRLGEDLWLGDAPDTTPHLVPII
jgi:type VI secretion system protein ImpH